MRLCWSTDIHLNFATLASQERWKEEVASGKPEYLLLTGDISESTDLLFQLDRISLELQIPIFFVLGNHDFYHSSIGNLRSRVRVHCQSRDRLRYLSGASPFDLSDRWSVVGHDGWGDGLLGDYEHSGVRLNDFQVIRDLHGLTPAVRYERMRELGRDAAETMRSSLQSALKEGKHVIVLTHVPPFAESCWYEGEHSDPNWLPFFACGAVGEMLIELADRFREQKILVLCGHTHHAGQFAPRSNLRVWTGAAEYGSPQVTDWIDLQTASDSWPISRS